MSVLAATHRPIRDFNWHIWEEHVYEGGDLPVELVELAEFHGVLHSTGLGHTAAVDELQARTEPVRVVVH